MKLKMVKGVAAHVTDLKDRKASVAAETTPIPAAIRIYSQNWLKQDDPLGITVFTVKTMRTQAKATERSTLRGRLNGAFCRT